MKKMGIPLILFAAMFAATNLYTTPANASCSIKELKTGAACSVQESSNINLEKSGAVQEKITTGPKGEKDLRPIRAQGEMQKLKDTKDTENHLCQIGLCLYKTLLGK